MNHHYHIKEKFSLKIFQYQKIVLSLRLVYQSSLKTKGSYANKN